MILVASTNDFLPKESNTNKRYAKYKEMDQLTVSMCGVLNTLVRKKAS